MKSKAIGVTGAVLLIVMIFIAVFAEQMVPYSPYQQTGKPFEKPSAAHLLGTNDIGQDICSELIYGTRISLLVGVLSAVISMCISIFVGVSSGWYGGALDRILMKITAVFMTIPFLPAVIILAAFTRGGVWSMSIILGFLSWPGTARLLRSTVMQIKGDSYIQIIQGMGAGSYYLISRHIIRKLTPLIFYRAVMRVKAGIFSESSMSFLGLGNPVAKSWGSIIYYAQAKNAILTGAWVWWIIPPGVCICTISMGLIMIASRFEDYNDSAREWLREQSHTGNRLINRTLQGQ
jgi:ABC-type dipeptide/oligopeptide/nickel transport system permease subunit